MHFEVVYTTGLSGFIGKNLLPLLLKKFPKIINFRRDNVHEVYTQDGKIEIADNKDLTISNSDKLFINIAALYNAAPKTTIELENLYMSNTILPINIIENYLGSKNLKIIQLASYFQLLDLELQTPYSLTKSLGMKYMEKNYDNVSFIYLFDTFGTGDNRNRVIDTFLNKIIDNKSIELPKTDVYINISHVSDVCEAIINSINFPANNYCIMSENTLSLREIAEKIMTLVGNNVDIEVLQNNIDYFANLNKDNIPENIFPSSRTKSFNQHLKSRLDEIKVLRSK